MSRLHAAWGRSQRPRAKSARATGPIPRTVVLGCALLPSITGQTASHHATQASVAVSRPRAVRGRSRRPRVRHALLAAITMQQERPVAIVVTWGSIKMKQVRTVQAHKRWTLFWQFESWLHVLLWGLLLWNWVRQWGQMHAW